MKKKESRYESTLLESENIVENIKLRNNKKTYFGERNLKIRTISNIKSLKRNPNLHSRNLSWNGTKFNSIQESSLKLPNTDTQRQILSIPQKTVVFDKKVSN